MQFSYDPQADALSLRLTDARIDDTDELEPGIIVDYDETGRVVAVEVLNVRKRTHPIKVNLETHSSVFGVSPHDNTIVDHAAGTIATGNFNGNGALNTTNVVTNAINTLVEA